MLNKAMQRKLEDGETLDVLAIGREVEPGLYEIQPDKFVDGADYCDAAKESWIWSIGRELSTGKVFAAVDGRFYENPAFDCLWLR